MTDSLKKILFIPTNTLASWGGSEKLWVELLKEFNQKDLVSTAILTKKWDKVAPQLDLAYNISSVYKIDYSYNLLKKIKETVERKLNGISKIERRFKKVLTEFSPELVIISQGGNSDGLEWMELCVKYKVNYITISQAATESSWPSASSSKRLLVSLHNAKLNLFVSHANLRLTEKQIVSKLKNAKVISNPYNVAFNNDIKYPEELPYYSLACVARFDISAKGQDVLIEALSDPKWKTRNIIVKLYGDGPHKKMLSELIEMFDLSDIIKIMDYTNPIDIWKDNHALILPSRYEGLPLALVEAMLCGRFGIVTDVSGNKEVLINEVNGFIAEAPQSVYVAKALEKAWKRRLDWKSIGGNARRHIQSIVPEEPILKVKRIILESI